MFSGPYLGLMVISGIFSLIGMAISGTLKRKFNEYSQVNLPSGLSGAEVAKKMLDDYGISDVKIVEGQGSLTDHYNPMNKTVNLSPDVYQGRNISSAAVAAHECGHAVQHATSYSFLKMRSAIVPVVKFSSGMQQYLLMFGLAAAASTGNNMLLYGALAAFAVTALFSLVTLPVEFDASNRALAWLENSNVATGRYKEGAKDALKWAALTYVAAATAALTQLLYLLFIVMGRRD